MRNRTSLPLSLVGLLVLAACGVNPQKNYQKMRPNLVAHNYEAANAYLESVKEKAYNEKSRLLYYMDKGMVLHLGKKYQESNALLEQAKTTAEELWTESVGEHAAAWLATDNSMSYQGEDFEKVLIHFVAALNYLGMGDYSAARVEARQITAKLELYSSKYEQEEDAAENHYRDDAFARWLSGKLAATDGEQAGYNDAWIDFRKAIEIYEKDYAQRYATSIPDFVVADALRALEALGGDFAEELTALKSRFSHVQYASLKDTQGLGEVVLIHLNGEAPHKVDRFWEARAGSDILRIAYPQFVAKGSQIQSARLTVGSTVGNAQLAENITAIAIQNLDDHMARIQVKAIARGVAKFIAGKAAQEGGKKMGGTAGAALQVVGALWNLGSAVAEEADKRSWITLPGAVNVGHVFTEPGDVTVNVDFLDANGQVVETAQLPATVQAGKTTFVTYRTYR
jgi:hypothetical protein